MIFFLWIFGVVNFVLLDPGRKVFCEHFSLTKKEKTEKTKRVSLMNCTVGLV